MQCADRVRGVYCEPHAKEYDRVNEFEKRFRELGAKAFMNGHSTNGVIHDAVIIEDKPGPTCFICLNCKKTYSKRTLCCPGVNNTQIETNSIVRSINGSIIECRPIEYFKRSF